MTILHKSIKGTFWLTLSQSASLVFRAISTVFIARWLGPEEYGYLPLIASILGIALIFGDAGLGPSTSYYLAQFQNNRRLCSALLFKILKLRTLFVLPVYVVFLILLPYMISFLKAPLIKGWLVIAVSFLFLIQVINRWVEKSCEGLGEAAALGRYQAYFSWLMPLSQLLLVGLGFGVGGAISGQVFGSFVIVTVLMFSLLGRHRRTDIDNSATKLPVSYLQVVRYALPLMVIHASFYIYMQSGILILKYFRNLEEVSYYGLVVQLVILIQIPALSFGRSTAPLIASAREESLEKVVMLVKRSLTYIVMVYAPIALFLYLLAPAFITTIFSEKYLPAALILRIYIPFMFCYALSGFVSLALDYSGKARLRMIFVFTSSILNIGLNLLLIPKYGMVGAAYASLVTYVPLVVVYLLLLKREYNISLQGFYSFALKLIGALVICGILICYISNIVSVSYITLILGLFLPSALYAVIILITRLVRIDDVRTVLVAIKSGG